MKYQSTLFWWGSFMLLIPVPPGPQTVLADYPYTYCVGEDPTDSGDIESACAAGEYCGINRLTGEQQDCVKSDKCPDNIKDETIVCSSTKPSCCCRTNWDGGPVNKFIACNNILDRKDVRKQACSLPELTNLPVCQRVWCSEEVRGIINRNGDCHSKRLCGIDMNSGRLQGCVRDSDCPANAKGSREIVCDKGSSSCCCQVAVPVGQQPVGPNCNNFKEDSSIWKQACGLKELSKLEVCQKDPSKTTTTTTTGTEEPTVTTDTIETSTVTVASTKSSEKVSGSEEEHAKNKKTGVTIAVSVIGGIIVLLIIGGLVLTYIFYKKRRQGTPMAIQQQQQQWMPQQAYQQPVGSTTGPGVNLSQSGTAPAN